MRTNSQANKQTDRQTDGLENHTHADRHSRRAWVTYTNISKINKNEGTFYSTVIALVLLIICSTEEEKIFKCL